MTPPPAPAIRYLVDNTEPVTGRIDNDAMTNDPCPTVEGAGQRAGDTILVYVDGILAGSTAVSADGTWSFRLQADMALSDGEHSLHAVEVSANGQSSIASERFVVTVGPAVPSRPLLDWVIDDAEPITGIVNRGGVTNDATPTLKGRGEIGTTIYFYDNGGSDPIGSTTVEKSGTWSFTPASPLEDGEHSFTAIAVNRFEHASAPSREYVVTVDTTAPTTPTIDVAHDDAGPIQGPIAKNGYTDDAMPTLTGNAEKNAIVLIRDGGTVIGSTTADDKGNWSFTPGSRLPDGEHDFTVIARDEAGNSSAASETYTVTVDTTGPGTVTIIEVIDDVEPTTGTVPNGGFTNDARPTLEGTAKPNAVVTIRDGDTVLGSVISDKLGKWQFTPALDDGLADGRHTLTAQSVDLVGQQSGPSQPYDIVVDTTPPNKPTIDEIYDDVGDVQGPIANNGYTDDAQPTLSGKAEAGSHVTILDGNQVLGIATVDATGHWTFTPPKSLSEGEHAFTVVARDAAGNTSAASDTFTVNVDTTGWHLPPPVILRVVDDVGAVTGPLSPRDKTDDAQPTICGTALRNSVVFVYDSVFGVQLLLGSTQADANGDWRFEPKPPAAPLVDGDHDIHVIARDEYGYYRGSSNTFPFTVLVGGVATAPAITGVLDATPTLAGNVAHGGITNDAHATVTGTARPGRVVHVYLDDKEVGSVVTDAAGRWWYRSGNALPDGQHKFTAVSEAEDGTMSPKTGDYRIVVDTIAPSPATGTVLHDNVGPMQGPIVNGAITDDATPTFGGKAEAGAIVTIYDGDKAIGSSVVNADGTWAFRPIEPLADGAHSLSTTVTDKAGNTSERGDSIDFTVDTTIDISRASVIAIETVTDHVGAVRGALQPGQSTDDTHPEIAGRATPNSLVKIYADGALVASVVAGADGIWAVKVGTALTDGTYDITATTTTAASGESKPTGPFTLTIDLTPPGKPTIDTATDDVGTIQGPAASGSRIDDKTPGFSGHAEAGAVVTIYDGDTVLGSTVADTTGKWTFTSLARLFDGEHVFTVVASDAAGNASARSDSYTLIVDTEAPPPPVITRVMDDVGLLVGNIISAGITDDSKPMFGGTSEPFALITLYAECDGTMKVLGFVRADEHGNWAIVPDNDMDDGVYHVSASATDVAGNVSDMSEPYTLQIDTTLPRAPSITDVIDDVGSVTGPLNHDGTSVTDDAHPTIKGTADTYALVYIYDKTGKEPVLIGSTKADANGKWQFEPDGDLIDGKHEITARVSGVTGALSDPSDGFGFTVETSEPPTPGTPEITAVYDGSNQVDPNGTTEVTRPRIVGKAAPGFTIYIYENGQDLIGSTVADQHGAWSFQPAYDLDDGIHAFSATSEGPDGETYGPSNIYVIEIESAWYRLDTFFAAPADGEAAAVAAQHAASGDATDPPDAWHAARMVGAGDDAPHPGGRDANVPRHADELTQTHRDGDGNTFVDARNSDFDSHADGMSAQPAVGTPTPIAPQHDGDSVRAPAGFTRDDAPGNLSVQSGMHRTDSSDSSASHHAPDSGVLTIGDSGALKLSLSDVLQDGARDLFADDCHTRLRVKGEAGDVLELSGLDSGAHDWISDGDAVIDGIAYTVYESGAQHAELLVQHGIDTHFA
ncbi:Ig-like domain-containing protein [Burkholderia orbicola]